MNRFDQGMDLKMDDRPRRLVLGLLSEHRIGSCDVRALPIRYGYSNNNNNRVKVSLASLVNVV